MKVIVQHNPQHMLDDFYRCPGLARTIEWSKIQEWWEPWKRNFKATSDQTINEFLDGIQSPANLIESAFHWSLTDEGRQYWTEAHALLIKHIEDDFRPFLLSIRGKLLKDKEPFVISENQFCELVGYGTNIFTEDIRLEEMCTKNGLCIENNADKGILTFTLQD